MRAAIAPYAGTRFARLILRNPIHRFVARVQGNGCIPTEHQCQTDIFGIFRIVRVVREHLPHYRTVVVDPAVNQPHRISD